MYLNFYTIFTYNLLMGIIMIPIYFKCDNLFNLESIYSSLNLFSTYFLCSTFATLLIVFYVVSVTYLINVFSLNSNNLVLTLINIQNSTIIYTKIIVWKFLLLMYRVKLGSILYTLFLASIYCDYYIAYYISIVNKSRNQYYTLQQYTNNTLPIFRLFLHLHNKYCAEIVFITFFYCMCDEYILLIFEQVNDNLVKITNFNFRILDSFINKQSLNFIFHYNILLFILQIIYLFVLHNYIKRKNNN